MHCPESFICLQEALHEQVTRVLNELNGHQGQSSPERQQNEPEEWSFIGVGRDDGKTAGEYSPIFYRPSVYRHLYFKNIWLSETPERPSLGWDAACNRILTIGIFEHRACRKMIVAMNTHMDHVGKIARLEGAKLIVAEVKNAQKTASRIADRSLDWGKREVAVFLAGDFNSESSQEAYQVLNGADSPVQDLRDLVPEVRRYGYKKTFTGFSREEKEARIDFLFFGKDRPWNPQMYSVLENCYDGVYCSDHRAVVGDLMLSTPDPEEAG